MGELDLEVRGVADGQRYLLTRGDVIAVGGTDNAIRWRLSSGRWLAVDRGVYQVDRRRRDWLASLNAAVLAAGDSSRASHRAALVLWGLDGIGAAPVEVTVPYTHGPVPEGTIVHRTRRPIEGDVVQGIPVTTPERTLLDCCALLPRLVMAKALESALRKRITTLESILEMMCQKAGRGVKGTKKLRWLLAERRNFTATGSGSETELLFHLREAMLPEPVLQKEFFSRDGDRMLPDFYWPRLNKAVEVDGLDAHDSADKLDRDLKRQNALLDLGIELRRFSAREVRRDPKRVVDEIRRFLGA